MEEVGELVRVIAREYGEQSTKISDEKFNLSNEMADILFVLICLVDQTGINLGNAIRENLQKNSS